MAPLSTSLAVPSSPLASGPSRSSVSKHNFAIPDLPKRAPLGMSTMSNLTSPTDHEGPTPAKLKRLSLMGRPGAYHPPGDASTSSMDPTSPGTPKRQRNLGVRSSISYSPALRAPAQLPFTHDIADRHDRRRSIAAPMQLRPAGDEGPGEQQVMRSQTQRKESAKGQTLPEKHADLLTLIAQKERRVNELKQELAAQEASLSQLKNRWTSIVTRSSGHHAAIRPQTGISHHRSASSHPLSDSPSGGSRTTRHSIRPSGSISTYSSSSLSTLSSRESLHSPDPSLAPDTPSFSSLLASIPAEGILGAEAVESSKRFWGNLVKTVSAAAGGTVPAESARARQRSDNGDQAEEGEYGNSGFDLTSLKSILPASIPSWAAPQSPTFQDNVNKHPPRPSNASRLPSRESHRRIGDNDAHQFDPSDGSAASPASDGSAAFGDLLGEVDSAATDTKVLTPAKPSPTTSNIDRASGSPQETIPPTSGWRDSEDDSEANWGW